ncbi:MAG TPA: amidohydrolase family protein [Candidatus Binataceae bacterium]|jgi:predicted TIM-barrel fold metal-dependent hydrolase|nr:amidohydrolase family protein [Candidatus Binataceae bacterium]
MPSKYDRIRKLRYPGAVDADGHILEAPDLWETYLEEKYKPRALRIGRDERGTQYLEIGGRPSKVTRGPILARMCSMGTPRDKHGEIEALGYGQDAPLGALDPRDRITRLDLEGLRAAFIYPTLALCWETECDDIELAQAYTRAYNRWIVDFCADSGGRLIPIAHLSLGDPEAAAQELERAVRAGCKGAWVAQFTMTRKPHAHPDHDVVFAKAQELGVPFGLHPTLEPVWALPGRYDFKYVRDGLMFLNVTASDAIRHALTSFFQFGTFDKFPRLKLVILEVGGGWVSYWLDRLDAVYATLVGRDVPLREKPSFYFQRQCWISADPDEHSLPAMVELCGEDKFFWASDFPHPDHTGDYIEELEKMAGRLGERARAKVLGDNVMRVYGCAA